MFLEGSLNEPPTSHHPTSSILHCYPLPIHHPSAPKNFDHTPAFSEMIKRYLQSVEGVKAECQLVTSIFILWLFLQLVNIINLVYTCLRTHNPKRGGRQLWVKTSVSWLIFLTRQLERGRDQTLWKRGRNPMTRHRNMARCPDTQIPRYPDTEPATYIGTQPKKHRFRRRAF